MKFTAACIQTNAQQDVGQNIEAIEPLLRDAGKKGAKFIALPENAFQMTDPETQKVPDMFASIEEHPGVQMVGQRAKEYGAWVLIGSIATPEPVSGRAYNTQVLINDQGEIAARYDKIHLFDVDLGNGERYAESNRFAPGNKAVVAQTPFGKLGMSICYDVRFPHLYRDLAQQGAEMLAVPAAFTKVTGEAHWHVLNRARAIENGCFVIAPAQTGTHPAGRKTFGHSLIIDPWGKVLADGGEETGIILTEIDLADVAKARGRVPSLLHGREYTVESTS